MPNLDLGRYRIYPRGFVGGAIGMRIQRNATNSETRFKQLAHNLNLFRPAVSSIDPNPAVKEMYTQYIKGRNATSSFDFKKEVYLIAVNAFGTQNFLEWFKQQQLSPVVGDIHRNFLDETLMFIETGKPRQLRLETWDSMLQITDRGPGNSPLSETAKRFFNLDGKSPFSRDLTNVGLIPVLCQWLSQPGGLSDLIGTMHLLYGDTP